MFVMYFATSRKIRDRKCCPVEMIVRTVCLGFVELFLIWFITLYGETFLGRYSSWNDGSQIPQRSANGLTQLTLPWEIPKSHRSSFFISARTQIHALFAQLHAEVKINNILLLSDTNVQKPDSRHREKRRILPFVYPPLFCFFLSSFYLFIFFYYRFLLFPLAFSQNKVKIK